jgi:nucleoside-triphosphatase
LSAFPARGQCNLIPVTIGCLLVTDSKAAKSASGTIDVFRGWEKLRLSRRRSQLSIAYSMVDGSRAILAHVDIRGPQRVGKYGVDVASMDGVAVPALHQAIQECCIVMVDKVCKMESLSLAFREALLEALNSGSRLLGTVLLSTHPFADQIKHDPRVEVLLVSKANRD